VHVTALSGGLGGARFALALQQAGLDSAATFVTNVADDWVVDGMLVCPDTDAVVYALEGRFDEERGWGVRGDVFPVVGTGTASWFSLGTQDRTRHRRRTSLLEDGHSLASATAVIASEAGIATRVIPAAARPRGTVVVTPAGPCAFQEWLVRDHAQPLVTDVRWPDDSDEPSAGVVEAIRDADVVVLTSSSPVASLEPSLGLVGVREELRARKAKGRPVTLVSPVVGFAPRLERDQRRHHARAALLAARGVAHEPIAVARLYADLVTHLVLDPVDASLVDQVPAGVTGVVAPVLDQRAAARAELVDACLGRSLRILA
jgi:LPPG:FO 2-phospho-L-lactate transferase